MKHYPIIIVEGPDATGKSTWTDKFCEKYSGRKVHLTLRKNMHAYQVGSLHLALKWSQECPVVIDRHWPSENIYAGAYRGGTNLKEESKWMAKLMADLGIFYVVALMKSPDRMIEAHAETFKNRKEMYSPSDNYRQVVLGYWDWWFGTRQSIVDIGHCALHAPACAKHMAAFQYDRDLDGKHLDHHVHDVFALAAAWRKHCMAEPFAQKVAASKTCLLKECGFKKPARSPAHTQSVVAAK